MRHLTAKPNIVVITLPSSSIPVEIDLVNFIELLKPLAGEIYAITGRYPFEPSPKIHIIKIKASEPTTPLLIKIVRFLLEQPKVTFHLLKISRNIDVVVLHVGSKTYVLPVLLAKLLRKKVVFTATGLASKSYKQAYANVPLGLGAIPAFIFKVAEEINLFLADQIAVGAPSVTDFLGLNRYREKIAVNSPIYIDTDLFTIRKEIGQRRNLVGYVGRFSAEKGILNFIRAIPLLSQLPDGTDFLINGDGKQYAQVKSELEINNLHHNVKLGGWLSHDDELPTHLNELKLLVHPSCTEGVPGIVREAMACGTPVLATPVGGVPDLIQDEKTGFILENNSPECIAKNILRALQHPKLEEIAHNARRLIEQEWAYKPIVEKWQRALSKLVNKEIFLE